MQEEELTQDEFCNIPISIVLNKSFHINGKIFYTQDGSHENEENFYNEISDYLREIVLDEYKISLWGEEFPNIKDIVTTYEPRLNINYTSTKYSTNMISLQYNKCNEISYLTVQGQVININDFEVYSLGKIGDSSETIICNGSKKSLLDSMFNNGCNALPCDKTEIELMGYEIF